MSQPSHSSPPASGAKPRLALFDLDHTLLPIDSDYEWGQFTARKGLVDGEDFARRNAEFFQQYKQCTLDLAEYVHFATEAIRRLGPEAAADAHRQFMAEVIAPALQAPARQLLDAHRQAGDTLLIVTATNRFVTAPIAAALGVEELIAVELARDASGWYDGRIEGVPSAREGKVTRVAQWLAQRGWDWGDVHTVFYSDSSNDLPLLEQVDEPVATNPDERLRQHALSRGWRVLDLFPTS